jgi:hypothetical protein
MNDENPRGAQNTPEEQIAELRHRLDTLEDNLAENYANLNEVLKLLMETELFSRSEIKAVLKKCIDGNCNRIPPGCKK